MSKPLRLGVVVQRYGAAITGGSESLARALATRLAQGGDSVTVFSTCALDYVTWRNELPPGESDDAGVRVRRFAVEEERDLAAFNRYSDELYARTPSRTEELEWLRRQGPYVPELVEALGDAAPDCDALLFFTYLYYPTWAGLQAVSARTLLVPTTHDEPPLRFSIYAEMFARASGFAFLTPPEEALVRSRFDLGSRPAAVAGMGVDLEAAALAPTAAAAFRARHGLRRPYVLYAGRIDAGKGCAEMLAHFDSYAREFAPAPDLVLLGSLAMELPQRSDVRYLGFVSEEEKRAAFAGASVVICPSPFESLSIVLLEALACRVPVLVNRRSAVLEDHCLRSGGGLFYADGAEFAHALQRLLGDDGLRTAMGESGRRYVEEQYAWPVVLGRYRALIAAI